jgi:membrane fusion protein, macrolide-specific efflux system
MKVNARVPVVVLRYSGFGVAAEVPAVHAYRLYDGPGAAQAQVTGGPGPVPCVPVESARSAQDPPAPAEGGVALSVLCLLPDDARVIAGLSALLGLRTAQRDNVLILPVQAVAGQAGRGKVAKLVNGQPEVVEVELGVTDGVSVEIVSGLAEGDRVLANGPGLLPATER